MWHHDGFEASPERERTRVNEAEVVDAKLHGHASETFQEDNGTWDTTTDGWPDRNIPIEGVVAIAKLKWIEKNQPVIS